MHFTHLLGKNCGRYFVSTLIFAVLLFVANVFAQETTGGLQGTVSDPSSAVVSHAQVVLVGTTLVGTKQVQTDGSGYYHFANLPPGDYTMRVTANGFKTVKRGRLTIEVGHLPTVDIKLEVGGSETVVEVTGEAPGIDVTTTRTQTNVTEDVINDVPHGRSFQSVIQFAPSARNEPLQGSTGLSNGTGGGAPGNMSNGLDYGYSMAGGADSENAYLVEGQSTANIQGGFSHTNVPFDFIQEVQIKNSGVEAEDGGALGGVVNVIMRKGGNAYHGSVFTQFENGAMDGHPTAYSRYDPLSNGTPTSWGFIDPAYQNYQIVKPKTSDVFPGLSLGGPIKKDRVFFFVGLNPEWNNEERFVNYGPTNGGILPFSRNTQTYYTSARVDAAVTQKIRVFGSWLYQYQRQNGQSLPHSDSTTGLFNLSTGCFGAATSTSNPCVSSGIPPFAYSHALGYAAPNQTANVGADITITPRLVATTRFGYYFENYHDFGYPQTGDLYLFQTNGIGATDATGAPLPAGYQQSSGYFNAAPNQNFTARNANKAIQFDQDLAWYKSGWWGTHNFKFGYQLNRLSNDLNQHFNEPATLMYVGYSPGSTNYNPATITGQNNCAAVEAVDQVRDQNGNLICQGKYGYVSIYDFGSSGKATSFNHGFYVQDAWTIGHGVTINAGLRTEREYLPGEGQGPGVPSHPINFGWGDKIAPRVGAAWDVFKDGRMKMFGSYGEFYDVMKLNLAISSFGGQYWQQCFYALDTPNLGAIAPAFNAAGRYCAGPSASSTANFAGGGTPAGLTFLENHNFRTFPTTCSTCSAFQEGVAPGLKPYKQHESVFGLDYQIRKNLAFEARWDRRRLDHVIEDSAIVNTATGNETFLIVNPGQGVNRTFLGFCNFLYGAQAASACTSPTGQYPPNNTIPAARSYDGVEFRLTKTTSQHWAGMFSYTYSHLRGNYMGLTSSDMADTGYAGRNAPNNSRSFDEPYFSWNAQGASSSGLLPTDRPNTFKGWAYYELGWRNRWTTDLGLFQYAYQGSPNTSFMDVGFGAVGGAPYTPVDVVNRGTWVNLSQDPTSGLITVGNPTTYRMPWYTQTDLNVTQKYKITETKEVSFSAVFYNALNQRAVTARNESMETLYGFQFGAPSDQYLFSGLPFYTAAMRPYSVSGVLNNFFGAPQTVNSTYGKPLSYQLPRSIRLIAKFTF